MATITNRVYLIDIQQRIDLKLLCSQIHGYTYNPKQFNAIRWKHPCLKGTCLVFRSGKLIYNGCATKKDVKKYARCYIRILQKKGYDIKFFEFKCITISAVYTSSGRIPLTCSMFKYEPELFNAATMYKGRVHFRVYNSGKVIITGICNEHVLENVVNPTLMEMELYVV